MKAKYLFPSSEQNIFKFYYTLQEKGFSLEYYTEYKEKGISMEKMLYYPKGKLQKRLFQAAKNYLGIYS